MSTQTLEKPHAASSAEATTVSNVGKRFPSEKFVFVDKTTGALVTALTNSPHSSAMIYPTHPQWAFDGEHIIFRSNRAGGVTQAFALHETTGEIIQLTDGAGTCGGLNVARKSNRLYFFRYRKGETILVEVELDPLLADSRNGTPREEAGAYEREIATIPSNLRESGGFALDADEKFAYVGVTRLDDSLPSTEEERAAYRKQNPESPIAPRPGGIRTIDLETGEIGVVVDVPFTMGHVQNNPWVPGEVIYCDETGGYTPHRIWCVRADGSDNRCLYTQTPGEWVTHEVVVGADTLLFNIMAHLPRLRTRPTGMACLNLRNGEMRILGQLEGRGFWHSNGSPDGRFAVGDDFDGNVHLVNRVTGEISLLTTGHRMKPDHAHPAFSPDSKRILIQSGLLCDGKSLDLMTIAVPDAR